MINPLTVSSLTEQQTVVLLPRSPSASKTYFPIPVDHLEEEYRLRSADDGKLFREEYNVSAASSLPYDTCYSGLKVESNVSGVKVQSHCGADKKTLG